MILVTSSKVHSLRLSSKLQNDGFKTINWSLFNVFSKKTAFFYKIFLRFHKIQSIIITSANAAEYLTKLNLNKNIKIFTIGSKTSNSIKTIGYKNIKVANYNTKSLLKLVLNNSKKEDGLILYLSGTIITEDLSKKLRNENYKSIRIKAYKTKEKTKIPSNILDKIVSGEINKITIFSKNSALILKKLLQKHHLQKFYKKIEMLCSSNEIVKFSQKNGFKICKKID
jgi:uroporphyrinogen-III synthase